MPAYFWMYNLYALERNSWKTGNRDRRKIKKQPIETDYLAPDTAEEIIAALGQMEAWMDAAFLRGPDLSRPEQPRPEEPRQEQSSPDETEDPEYDYSPGDDEELPATGLERRNRGSVILKPRKAQAAYRTMLHYYAMKTLALWLEARPEMGFKALAAEMEASGENPGNGLPGGSLLNGGRVTEWVNLGGQIVPAFRVDALRQQIREGAVDSWEAIHGAYAEMAAAYPLDRARHAWGVLRFLWGNTETEAPGTESPGAESLGTEGPLKNLTAFKKELQTLIETREWIAEQVYLSRAKDFHDPFRGITYRNKEEMEQVVGTAADNFFVTLVRDNTKIFTDSVKKLMARLNE
jgi:hypothetical protein